MNLMALPAEPQITELVRRFYAMACADTDLDPFFNAAISDWDEHYQIVADFWSRAPLGTQRYQGSPYQAHAHPALKPLHFERWLDCFRQAARHDSLNLRRPAMSTEHENTLEKAIAHYGFAMTQLVQKRIREARHEAEAGAGLRISVHLLSRERHTGRSRPSRYALFHSATRKTVPILSLALIPLANQAVKETRIQ
jgi:truncated hemoglobin YjbI